MTASPTLSPDCPLASKSNAEQSRICLLVLGMHRSGTSAVAHVLSLLGAALPMNLLGAGPGNEKGHWEPAPLVAAHTDILAEFGSAWDDWRKLDLDRLGADRRAATRARLSSLIQSEFGTAPFVALKEPRICRFVPLYLEMLADHDFDVRAVLPLRNPLGVVASLKTRDGMSEGFASLLWLRYVLEAEAGTRGRPRTIVSYEELLAGWRPTVGRMGAQLGLRWPRSQEEAGPEIADFLSAEHRHHAPSRHELAASRDIAEWVKVAYEALLRLEQDPGDDAACVALDQIGGHFESACTTFGAAMFSELVTWEARIPAEQQRLGGQVFSELAARKEEIGALRTAMAKQSQQIGGLEQMIMARDAEIGRIRCNVAEHQGRVRELELALLSVEGELESLQGKVGALKAEMAVRERRIAELQSALGAAREGERTDAKAEASAKQDEIAGLRSHILQIHTSTSWRITRPLRLIGRLARQGTQRAI